MRSPDIHYLTDIYFACGAVRLLPDLLEQFQVRRPLIVTDRGLVQSGHIQRLPITPAAVFDNTSTNPTESAATEALDLYRASHCDGLVAFGGGAPMDLAKIIALLVNHPLPLAQYAILRGGIARITRQIPPLIAIPTTAGSGSEVGRAALLTLSLDGHTEKMGFLSPHLIPRAAICDPELTLSLPPRLTAATGMDAISHCVEAFCSPRQNSVADAIALDGLARGFHHIERAWADGSDLQARTEMLRCSLHGGLSFQKGLGAVHSLSHPLGALTSRQFHHGTLNAVFLPTVLRFNADSCRDKFDRIARQLALPPADLPDAFAQLNQRLNLPPNLTALGLTAADLEPLAARAAADHCSPTNPRSLTIEDCRALYLAAL